jgi:AraC-like DNA-binding protein
VAKRGSVAARILSDGQWLAALADARNPLACPQLGHGRCHEQWVVQPRSIAEHLVYLVSEASLHGRVGGRRLRLDPGSLVWVMPGVTHEFWLPEAGPRTVQYHVKLALTAADGAALRLAGDAVVVGGATAVRPYLDEALREPLITDPFSGPRLRSLLALCFSSVLRLSRHSGRGGPVLDGRQREHLARFLARRVAQRVTPAELAAELDLNPDYFTRLFRRSYGIPPRTWILRQRMGVAAARLREAAASVSAIAGELGYPDVFLFSRQFKQVFGRSPMAYRRDDGSDAASSRR